MNEDIKVMNTADLTELNNRAIRSKFNRTLAAPFIAMLDPNGNHIASLILWGHNADSAHKFHHRARVLCKIIDHDKPVMVLLDIADEDWARLHTPAEFKDAADSVGGV